MHPLRSKPKTILNELTLLSSFPNQSVMTVLRNAKPDVKDSVKALFKVFNETLFIEVSVHDLIWGYEDLLLKNLAPLAKEMNITLPPNNVIGLFTDVSHFLYQH